jgi:hypothetical protein
MKKLAAADVRHVVPNEVYERYQSADGARTYHALFGTFPAENLAHAKANARRLLARRELMIQPVDRAVL